MTRPLLLSALVICGAFSAGCKCKGNTIEIDGGSTGGGVGGGGGSATGGGSGGGAGGGADWDAGDGTQTGGVQPGTFTLDGGLTDGQGNGVKLDPSGNVVLNTGSLEFHFMWIANAAQATVSKFDTRTGKETARYYSVIPKDCSGSAGPPCDNGKITALRGNNPNSPSRTAIDLFGDMWVANRYPGGQGSVTKIANDESSCVDRNKNGKIDTSRDVNGDGQISTNPADGEMIVPTNWADPLQYDECVLFSTPVGAPATNGDVTGRAIAISRGLEGSAGDVWLGIYSEQNIYKLRPDNGQVVPVNAGGDPYIHLANWGGAGAYGFTIDSKQRLWAVYPGVALLAEIDTATGKLVNDQIKPPAGMTCGSYAIGIDGKDRVWLPGWTSGSVACRYDPATGMWTSFDFSTAVSDKGTPFGRPRGIAVDDTGVVFMDTDYNSAGAAAQLIKFDAETGAIIPFPTGQFIDATDANTNGSIGCGIDADGQPWINNYSGNAMRIDRNTGVVTRTAQQPAGLYTYSDFTGYELRKYTAPRGSYKKVMVGCDAATVWKSVTWDADTPPNTKVQVFVKVANTIADLSNSATQRYGPFETSPADLVAAGVPTGQYMQVEFVLLSNDGKATPVLKSFNVVWACSGTIN